MRTSRGTLAARFGALAAAAAIAVGGGAAVAGASTAAPTAKLPTALSIRVSPTRTHHHVTFAAIGGRLTSSGVGLKFKPVWLAKRPAGGKWHLVRRELTNRSGHVRFLVHTRKTARYALVFRGKPNFHRSHSAIVIVKVPAQS